MKHSPFDSLRCRDCNRVLDIASDALDAIPDDAELFCNECYTQFRAAHYSRIEEPVPDDDNIMLLNGRPMVHAPRKHPDEGSSPLSPAKDI
jgi:hypothetical protein